MHIQVSKDLCRLSSELPFDLEECELAMEEDAAGGVDLKKLVKVRACMGYTWGACHLPCGVCMVRARRVAWCVHRMRYGVVCAWRGMFICAQGACPARLLVAS